MTATTSFASFIVGLAVILSNELPIRERMLIAEKLRDCADAIEARDV